MAVICYYAPAGLDIAVASRWKRLEEASVKYLFPVFGRGWFGAVAFCVALILFFPLLRFRSSSVVHGHVQEACLY